MCICRSDEYSESHSDVEYCNPTLPSIGRQRANQLTAKRAQRGMTCIEPTRGESTVKETWTLLFTSLPVLSCSISSPVLFSHVQRLPYVPFSICHTLANNPHSTTRLPPTQRLPALHAPRRHTARRLPSPDAGNANADTPTAARVPGVTSPRIQASPGDATVCRGIAVWYAAAATRGDLSEWCEWVWSETCAGAWIQRSGWGSGVPSCWWLRIRPTRCHGSSETAALADAGDDAGWTIHAGDDGRDGGWESEFRQACCQDDGGVYWGHSGGDQ